ncbi:MAG: hypothetical protein HY654_07850 [Acidobacteria bacterium]|nr:hypothetical protein [Acidobacteriota bacterium]
MASRPGSFTYGTGRWPALRFTRRVALGTDGFPSDMRGELDVLRSVGGLAGEDDAELARRLDRGHALVEERFGRGIEPAPHPPSAVAMAAIRCEAESQAARLFARMQRLEG